MRRESLSALSELTGFDRRTVKTRLASIDPIKQGKAHLYETEQALAAIYCPASDKQHIDYQEEKARLTYHQANMAALDEEEKSGSLVKVEDVIDLWCSAIANAKTKLLALPSKITHQLLAADDHKMAVELFKEYIHEALEELASGSIGKPSGSIEDALDAATESDG